MLLFILFYILTCHISLASARADLTKDDFCFVACQQILRGVRFNGTNPTTGDPWPLCGNELEYKSLYLCNHLFCTDEERERGIEGVNKDCRNFSNATVLPYEIIERFTDEAIEKLNHLEAEDMSRMNPRTYNEVLVPSTKLYGLAWGTLDAAFFEGKIHITYGFAMYYFWVIVITIGLSTRLLRFSLHSMNRRRQWQAVPSDPYSENSVATKASYPYTLLKRYITVPATFGFTHAQANGWSTIPTRIQSLTITAFIIMNILLCSISYHVFENNLYWPHLSTQIWRYVADRTGIISTANLALIWAFGIRNNTLLWLTGWDFATYNNFHRWVARIATVQAVVHSVAYTVLIFERGTLSEAWNLYAAYYRNRWFVAGVLATIFMVAICGFSVYPLRRKFYELFLILHIILSVLVIPTMWYHVEIFNGAWNGFIYPLVFIWVFDRSLRLLRILLFNPKFWNTKAQVNYDPTSNIIRLIIPYSTSFIKPLPGTFYFITSLHDRIWESHPFTLSYSTSHQPLRSPSSLGTITPPSRSPTTYLSRHNSSDSEFQTLLSTSETPSSSMVFIIRPYVGFTSRLLNSANSSPIRMLIDGPYGKTQPFHTYSNIIFIVGGTGIAVPLSYLANLLESPTTMSIKIIWAVREHKFLTDTTHRDLRGSIGHEKLSLEAYITQSSEIEGEDKDDLGLKIQIGRPNVFQEVEKAVRDSAGGSLAVVACGPGMMADESRRAVVNMLGGGYGNVEYFEESFNW